MKAVREVTVTYTHLNQFQDLLPKAEIGVKSHHEVFV